MSTATSWASWAVGAIGAKFYKSATPPPGSSQQTQGQSNQQVPSKDGQPTSTKGQTTSLNTNISHSTVTSTSNPKRTAKSNDSANTERGEHIC